MNRKRKIYDKVHSGLRIQTSRMALNMTQEELGNKIDRAPKYVSDIERGKCGMSLDTAISFAEALGVPVDYILFGDDRPLVEDDTFKKELPQKTEFSSVQDIYHFYFNASPAAREAFLKFASTFADVFPNDELD